MVSLNKDFKQFLDQYYVGNPARVVPDLPALLKSAALYAREQLEDVPAEQYAAALSAVAAKLLKCMTCDVPIDNKLNKFGKPFRFCIPCSRDWNSKQNAKVGSSVKPGPVIPKQSTAAKTLARANVAAASGSSSASAIPVGDSSSDSDSDED